jgi:acid stress chaperone HdeB
MMRFVGIVSALIFALDAIPAARAQVMLDVAKITCEQFAGYKITTPENVAIWLSGYYHGKRGTTVVDMQKLLADTKTMQRYCLQNPQTLVMNAVETVLGVGKWRRDLPGGTCRLSGSGAPIGKRPEGFA